MRESHDVFGRPRRSQRSFGLAVQVVVGEEGDQPADGQASLTPVTEGLVQVEGVAVAAADPFPGQVAGLVQVRDDAVHRAVGDADADSDVTGPRPGAAGDLDQRAGVVGEERPGGGSALGCVHGLAASVLWLPVVTQRRRTRLFMKMR